MPFKYVSIAAREKFLIFKNGSDYQGAWPPLIYTFKAVLLKIPTDFAYKLRNNLKVRELVHFCVECYRIGE